MKISEEVEYTPGIMASKSALMEVYYMNNDLNALYKVYNELYAFYISSEDHLKLNKIKMFKGFGLVKEHKYIQALSFLEKAYIGSNRIGDIQSKKRIAEKLITTHTALQNFEKADEFDKVYRQLQDSLDNDKRLLLTEELKEKYETEKITQEKEQAEINEQFAQELAVKNRKLFIASIIGSASLLFLALIFIYQIQLKKRAELSEAKLSESENRLQLERKLNDAEMKALRSQMNPHFLFNAFNSIQEFIILNDRELASDYLGKFADLMRLYLDQSKEKLISLENEISTTSLYFELEKIRFEETLTYEIKVAKDIDTTMKELPPMLIQPFIENSLKHGLFHKKENRQLKVNFTLENQTLICTIADNGIGRKQSAILNANRLKKHKSFATSATQNRIELLNVGRSEDITLHIFDLIDDKGKALGTRVEIKIPKHESNNY
jgi:LytS/YehU family sensor histidine kinase